MNKYFNKKIFCCHNVRLTKYLYNRNSNYGNITLKFNIKIY